MNLNNSFLKRVGVLASSTAGAQLIALMTLPIVTRLFSVHDIGLISLVTAIFSFSTAIMSFKFENAILISSNREKYTIASTCLYLIVLNTLLISGLFSVFYFAGQFGFDQLPSWTAFFLLATLPGLGLFNLNRALWLRNQKTRNIAQTTLLRSLGQSLGRIAGGVAQLGISGLFIGEFLLAWAVAPFLKSPRDIGRLAAFAKGKTKAVVKKYSNYILLEFPSTLMNNLALFLPVPLVANLYGIESAGIFGIAHRIATLPVSQVSRAVADVTQMEMADAYRKGEKQRVKELFWTISKRLFVFALLPLIASITLAPFLIGYILGQEWSQAGYIIAILSPWLFAQTVVGPITRILILLQRQELKLLYDVFILGIIAALYFITTAYKLSFIEFSLALSLALAAAQVPYFLLCKMALNSWIRQTT